MRIVGQDVDAGEGGPRRELPRFAKVLVVVAHPDDEAFGLGAVISALLQQGTGADLLCFSRGEESSPGPRSAGLAAVRERELQAASALLGIGHVELRNYPDGVVRQSEGNPFVWRRLELTGDVEYLRYLPRPDPGSRPGRPVQGVLT